MFLKRLYKHHQIIHRVQGLQQYKQPRSSIFKALFGIVKTLERVQKCCGECVAYALVKPMERADVVDQGPSFNHMVTLKSPSNTLVAVSVQDILDACIHVTVDDDISYVSCLPNQVEKE